VVITQLTGVRH